MNEFIYDKKLEVLNFQDLPLGTIFKLKKFDTEIYIKIRDIRPALNANCICLNDGLYGLCSDKDEILAVYTKFKVMK
jgi:hypothetical protein